MSSAQDRLTSSLLRIDDAGLYAGIQEPPRPVPSPSTAFSRSLAALIDKQSREFDFLLRLQEERLRAIVQEAARKQLGALLESHETKMMSLMWQKDEDLAMAARKTMELEELLRRMETESQAWQRLARENEAKVLSLHNTLSQARELATLSSSGNGDEQSSCGSCDDQEQSRKMGCKVCNARSSCVVLLPCRHLSCCKSCEGFLGFCPVCQSVKEASMEIFLA
ncbi:BOI-related E3 ubiquitin-protein ligase 1-like [Diospyros lotus]|uniref:BOI-related E3 ubiquitin-protein ligase 1-like n=1 Tax=Diospyros lotus TaxID=55363 RepID=UPI002258BB3D|nr:BOI-related E3 ubiquitin-protein ligase 1-like [Diospyros lotus]